MIQERGTPEPASGVAWWPFRLFLRSPLDRRAAPVWALWGTVTAISILLAFVEAKRNWSGLPFNIGGVSLAFSVYPPVAISALVAFWLGPTFGGMTAYLSTFVSGIAGGLAIERAALFALGTPAEVALLWFLSVMLRVRPDLPNATDIWRFIAASLIAATASSVDIMLYNEAHRLPLEEGQRLWLGWILGDIAQLTLIVAPVLRWRWREMHQYALVRIGTLPQRELSAPKTVLLVAFVWVTLGSLALMGLRLLVRALDIPDEAITVSGDLLLPRLREMGVFLSVFVGVLLLSTMALTAALAGAGEKHFERSLRDELTGAFNRRAFRRLFRREAERSHSLNLPVSIAYIDIDHFKLINDRHGHSAGDNILVEVTRQIQAILRPQDLLFRWGGEEYLILLSHTTRDEAREFSETVRQRVAANVDTPGAIAPEPVTVSIGVATISPGAPGAGADLNLDETDLIEAADQALYSAKASGRNRVVTDLMLDPDRR